MALIALKCPNCNGDIQLDDQKEFGFCMYCGCKVMLESATSSVTLDRTDELRNILSLARDEYSLKHWDKGDELSDRALVIDSTCPDAWFMKALSAKRKGDKPGYEKYFSNAENNLSKSMNIFHEDDIDRYFGIPIHFNLPPSLRNRGVQRVNIRIGDVVSTDIRENESVTVGLDPGSYRLTLTHYFEHSNDSGNISRNARTLNVTAEASYNLVFKVGGYAIVPVKK